MMKARALSHALRRVAWHTPPRCFSTLGDTLKAKVCWFLIGCFPSLSIGSCRTNAYCAVSCDIVRCTDVPTRENSTPISHWGVCVCVCVCTLQSIFVLLSKERVEEDRFIRQQTEEQLASLRQAQEEKRQLRQQLWDDLRLENTMEDLQYILRDETISPEAMRRLAEWKTSGTV